MARLQEVYRTTLVPQIQEELGLKNVMEVPKLTKITLNMGLGEAVGDKKIIEN
ncbi:MAG: 50S ribosomal protein L5, partial [Pseudomonadaceae bacterium]